LLAFVGAPGPGQTVTRHLNGDPADNRLANLAWGTPRENGRDTVRHGRCAASRPRDDHPATKFTTSIVAHMRARRAAGLTDRAIAAEFRTAAWYARHLMATVGA
jgi:hypothetical protein